MTRPRAKWTLFEILIIIITFIKNKAQIADWKVLRRKEKFCLVLFASHGPAIITYYYGPTENQRCGSAVGCFFWVGWMWNGACWLDSR